MKFISLLFITSISVFLNFSALFADLYQGISMFERQEKMDYSMLVQFLPYNPTIVEAGAFRGNETIQASKIWPEGRIFAFEPNPEAFYQLEKAIEEKKLLNVQLFPLALNNYDGNASLYLCNGMNGLDSCFGYASSLLPTLKNMSIYCVGPKLQVPCVRLDNWCQSQDIQEIDLLKLELEGFEMQVLESSTSVLKNIKIICVKTFIHPHRSRMTDFDELKGFLENENFVLIAHRYQPGITGHAIFLSRELFDAYFKKSLGIYLEI